MPTHLPLPDLETARPALAAEYAAARERRVGHGDPPRHGPAALGRRERELLAVATSEANGADYSTAIHTRLLERRGGAHEGDRDGALTAFATRLTLRPREAGEAVAALRENLTDDEVHDAIAVVGLLNLANRTALATGITEADDLS